MRVSNKFINPRLSPGDDGYEYDWPINHETEEAGGRTRNVTHTANTANVGLVRQQGVREPLLLRYAGTILTRDQMLTMWDWFELCSDQTIYFEDFEGNIYEVIITAFQPLRKRASKNPRDPTNAPLHTYTYTIEMDVISIRPGSPLRGHA